ncbi:MAG: SpoIID/LytB domain-containing protein [Candidatus Limnocylindrales bacterium]
MHRAIAPALGSRARRPWRTTSLAVTLALAAALFATPGFGESGVAGASGVPGPLAAAGLLGALGPSPVLAAAQCTGWTSDTTPPAAIRVLRTAGPAAGTVQVVPFQQYVDVVMAAEWGPGDPAEALKAGAVAVKQYAWYHAMYWRGGTAPDGACYDVVDSSMDQVYSPETETPSTTEIAAVQATWGETLLKSGAFFATHYDGGSSVPCGANADGWHLYQVSAMHCAEGGMLADAILQTYYGPNLVIVGSGAPGSSATAAALRFTTQPRGGTAGLPLSVQPSLAVVDANGQPLTTGPGSTPQVTLALASGPPGAVLSCTGGLSRAAVAGVATFQGCAVNAAGGGYVLLASAPGLAPATSAPFTASVPTPTVSLAADPAVITWGTAATVTIRMTPGAAGENVAGRTVHVQSSADGQSWGTVADVVTDASGVATLSQRPATNLWYRAVFDGAPDLGPADSPGQRVLVRQLAVLRPDNGAAVRLVPRGATVAFTTVVRPARPELGPGRVLYRVYLLVGRAWTLKREATVVADASGRAGLSIGFPMAGRWYVQAIALPTARNANSVWSAVERYLVS